MFTVLLTDTLRVEIRSISRPLARLFRVPLIDITTHLRKARGFVYDDVDEEVAKEVARLLNESGQPAVWLPTQDVPQLPAPRRVSWAEVTEEELLVGVVYAEGDRVSIPWTSCYAGSVGVVRLYEPELKLTDSKEFQQMMRMQIPEERELMRKAVEDQVLTFGQSEHALPPQIGESLLEQNTKLPLEYHFDMILTDPLFVLRISQHEFSYGALEGAGTSALANFHMLVGQILRRAPHVQSMESAERFLAGTIREVDLFDSIRQFEGYNRWRFALMQLDHGPVDDELPVLPEINEEDGAES